MYKLNKSLYGLKQSGRNWNHVLHCFLLENSFAQSPVDNCVYAKHAYLGRRNNCSSKTHVANV